MSLPHGGFFQHYTEVILITTHLWYLNRLYDGASFLHSIPAGEGADLFNTYGGALHFVPSSTTSMHLLNALLHGSLFLVPVTTSGVYLLIRNKQLC